MLAHLADVSIRSFALALIAALVLWTLRSRRTAALQHAIWTAVICGMLALFAFGAALPRLPLRVLDRPDARKMGTLLPVPASNRVLPATLPEGTGYGVPAFRLPTPRPWSEIALYVYAAITFAFLARFVTGMLLARRLLMRSTPAGPGFLESTMIAVPLTIGLTRPKILLPLEWREWDREKLDAVLAHEGAHVRRRDGLVAPLAGVNRCIFWFHPLAWWMERRLGLLAELACDESCVAALGNRQEYARLLLDMARVVDAAHGRLQSHALTMAASSHLRQRIDSILKEAREPSRGLRWTGWAAVALCGIPVVLCAGTVEFTAPPPLLQLAMPRLAAPSPPVLLAQIQTPPPAGPQISGTATVNASEALVKVGVLTSEGRFVTGLERDNFQITEGDADSARRGFPDPHEIISTFFPAEGRLAVGLVFISANEMTSLASIFRNALHPNDESFIVQGDSKPLVDLLSGAIVSARQAKNPVKALVVITQGARNNPWGPERDISALARQAGNVSIYFADIEDASAGAGPDATAYSQVADLRAISTLTGGDYIPVANASGMGDTMSRLAMRLRSQYVLGYIPSVPTPAGSLRRFSVELKRIQGLGQLQVVGSPGFVLMQ
jgi:hypothetical protein